MPSSSAAPSPTRSRASCPPRWGWARTLLSPPRLSSTTIHCGADTRRADLRRRQRLSADAGAVGGDAGGGGRRVPRRQCAGAAGIVGGGPAGVSGAARDGYGTLLSRRFGLRGRQPVELAAR